MSTKLETIKTILTNSFTSASFLELSKELFDNAKLKDKIIYRKEMSNFSSHVERSAHIGDYEDPQGKKVVIYAVELKQKDYVENSRSTQRNYAKSIINNNNYDAALVAYYMHDDKKWRLSFVRLDYEIKFDTGKFKTQETLTPAKRYSFLVGCDEPCHTAIKQLSSFIENDNYNPTLDEIEDAFGVEKVTKEFYNLYCEKYHQLQEYLKGNTVFQEEAARHNFDSVQFAKKLMGQIVFLYFLQKKGWLGVNVWPPVLVEKEYNNIFYASSPLKNEIREVLPKLYPLYDDGQRHLSSAALYKIPEYLDKEIARFIPRRKTWGDGPHDFMRILFEDAKKNNANFFDEYLEPLFYDAMNKNRGEHGYYSKLHCRIPFLSGGLFEPIDGYDWENTNFNIPNTIFSDRTDDRYDEGEGILDIFDKFNFTMSEDEPLEREVAIDPEMLGKVFENLLEIKDRKSKGAYYTPREVVHYMCQESLIDYLVANLDIPSLDIREFILYGSLMKDEDLVQIDKKYKHEMLIPNSIFQCNEDGIASVNRLQDLDTALAKVKIADPAVGSGAYPLGLLNEIVKARETISAYMTIGKSSFERRKMYKTNRSPYLLKKETIKNCIFAVDIDPSAVDIARLRLWLALVIDDNVVPDSGDLLDHANPIPLPNLECNIICGNSLKDSFKGVALINTAATNEEEGQQNLGRDEFEYYLDEISKTQTELFNCDNVTKKEEYKNKLFGLRKRLLYSQVKNEGAGTDSFYESLNEAEISASKPYTLWPIDFPVVFKDNGGFDIVIGNPPYGAKFEGIDKALFKEQYYTAKTIKGVQKGSLDSYTLFIELAFKLTKKNGVFSYIVPISFVSSDSLSGVHNMIYKNCSKLVVSTYAVRPQPVFEHAVVNTAIFKANKTMTPIENVYTTKMHRKTKEFNLGKLLSNMEFVEAKRYALFGRIPKIGKQIELNILFKINKKPKFGTLLKREGAELVYRFAGGRYFKVITPYSNGSSAERIVFVDGILRDALGCVLSSSLSFWFYQIYSDNLNWKNYELESFPIPELCGEDIEYLSDLYQVYLKDIEDNANIRTTSESSSYKVLQFKEYKIGKSKAIIDKIDDYIGPLYGLSQEEIDFIKNYEIDIRLGDDE